MPWLHSIKATESSRGHLSFPKLLWKVHASLQPARKYTRIQSRIQKKLKVQTTLQNNRKRNGKYLPSWHTCNSLLLLNTKAKPSCNLKISSVKLYHVPGHMSVFLLSLSIQKFCFIQGKKRNCNFETISKKERQH